eukprot:TRINITY_DN23861_c0_g1_i2.p1 TRINITY_DN23861_c0_g1~~TRINITY_DN23861_c0_g1_i2.p1  ORF type:complete len:435 (-),score=43.45 TRINITY_DN23861_c0_g1_i2:1208-2512(-)
MTIIYNHMRRYGLRCNMQRAKTEALILYRGPKSESICRQNFDNSNPIIDFETQDGNMQLRLTKQYTHLGTVFDKNLRPNADISRRSNLTKASYHNYNDIFRHPDIDITAKLYLIETVMMPRLLHHAALWQATSDANLRRLRSQQLTMHRQFLFTNAKPRHVTNTSLYTYHNIVDIDIKLRRIRLLHFASLATAPQALRAALYNIYDYNKRNNNKYNNYGYYYTIAQDIKWMTTMTDKFDEIIRLGDPYDHINNWYKFATQHRQAWKTILKTIVNNIRNDDQPYIPPELEADNPVTDGVEYLCKHCGKGFCSFRALTAHNTTVHAKRHLARRDGICRCCMKCYSNHNRLQAHLSRSAKCLQQVQLQGCRPLDTTQQEAIRVNDSHRARKLRQLAKTLLYAEASVQQCYGPRLPVIKGPVQKYDQPDNDHNQDNEN